MGQTQYDDGDCDYLYDTHDHDNHLTYHHQTSLGGWVQPVRCFLQGSRSQTQG